MTKYTTNQVLERFSRRRFTVLQACMMCGLDGERELDLAVE